MGIFGTSRHRNISFISTSDDVVSIKHWTSSTRGPLVLDIFVDRRSRSVFWLLKWRVQRPDESFKKEGWEIVRACWASNKQSTGFRTSQVRFFPNKLNHVKHGSTVQGAAFGTDFVKCGRAFEVKQRSEKSCGWKPPPTSRTLPSRSPWTDIHRYKILTIVYYFAPLTPILRLYASRWIPQPGKH